MDVVAALLREAELVGLTVKLNGGQLSVEGPRSEAGLVERLRQRKGEVVAYLRSGAQRNTSGVGVRFIDSTGQQDRKPYQQAEREAMRSFILGG